VQAARAWESQVASKPQPLAWQPVPTAQRKEVSQ
jgi:hypothetical protein